MSEAPLGESLATLSRFLVGELSVADTLHRVAELTVEAVPAADVVGLTMLLEGRPRTPVFTNDLAPEVDQAQYDSGEGPCLDAFEKREVFAIDSTVEDGSWPASSESRRRGHRKARCRCR